MEYQSKSTKKKKEQLAEELLLMQENNQRQRTFVKLEANNKINEQIAKAVNGEDFVLRIDGEDYSNIKGHSKEEINKILKFLTERLHNTNNQEDFEKLKKLIKMFYAELEDDQEKEEKPREQDEPDNLDPKDKDLDEQQLKAKDYGEYAEQKLYGQDKTVKPQIDTSEFDGKSREELLEYFKPDVFYGLSALQQQALYQACVNEYLRSEGVDTCAVIFEDMKLDDQSIVFGQYRPNHGAIYLNRRLFENIAELGGALNPFFPLRLLQTAIHEARHRVQFMRFGHNPTTPSEREIQASMTHDQGRLSYAEYLSEADELDARNAALGYLREAAERTGNQDIQAFYWTEWEREKALPKGPTSSTMMDACGDIYDRQIGLTAVAGVNHTHAHGTSQQMMAMLHGQTFGYASARTKR